MKKFSTFIILLIGIIISAQVPKFVKYPIADTGAQFYFPAEPKWQKSISEDKSEIYITTSVIGDVEYGIIVVKLAEEAVKGNENPEALMVNYVNYLNENVFKFTKKTDFGKGHTLENQPNVKGILEYAETEDSTKYTVKSWTNKSMIAVMYMGSKKEVNNNFQEIYFKGIRFNQ